MVRAHDLRHARYRGLAKVRLQNYMIGAACNAKRWIRRLQWQTCGGGVYRPRQKTIERMEDRLKKAIQDSS